jgi:hypothetical protein
MRKVIQQRPGGEAKRATATTMAPGKRTLTEGLVAHEPVIQEKHDADSRAPEIAAPGGAGAALPAPVQAKMGAAFGADFSPVRVHEGSHVSSLGALAYTQGTDIHFAPGQYDPHGQRGQELLGHELTHVVQQSEGRVSPTMQAAGLAVNDDAGLEREADELGARAARGESVATGTPAVQPAPSGGAPAQRKLDPSRGVVQLAAQTTHWGKFIDTVYTKTSTGVEAQIDFEPGDLVDAKKIGMTQSIKATGDGKPIMTDPSQEGRYVASGAGEGHRIDRVTSKNNPIYGAESLGSGKGLKDTESTNAPSGETPSKDNATYELGYRYNDSGALKKKNAWMYDAPTRAASNNSSMIFETTALAIDGAQTGEYYGSVKWGWERGSDGVLKKIDFAVVSQGAPSQNFLAPAAAWNSATTRGTLVARNAPTQVYKMSSGAFAADFTIDKDTKVTTSGSIGGGGVEYRVCSIVDGAKAGSTGYIKVPDLKDKGDGGATVDLPVPDVHMLDAEATLNEGVTGTFKFKNKLAKGTRVVPTGKTTTVEKATKKWVKVVDGPDTGAEGYVDATALKDERP